MLVLFVGGPRSSEYLSWLPLTRVQVQHSAQFSSVWLPVLVSLYVGLESSISPPVVEAPSSGILMTQDASRVDFLESDPSGSFLFVVVTHFNGSLYLLGAASEVKRQAMNVQIK